MTASWNCWRQSGPRRRWTVKKNFSTTDGKLFYLCSTLLCASWFGAFSSQTPSPQHQSIPVVDSSRRGLCVLKKALESCFHWFLGWTRTSTSSSSLGIWSAVEGWVATLCNLLVIWLCQLEAEFMSWQNVKWLEYYHLLSHHGTFWTDLTWSELQKWYLDSEGVKI